MSGPSPIGLLRGSRLANHRALVVGAAIGCATILTTGTYVYFNVSRNPLALLDGTCDSSRNAFSRRAFASLLERRLSKDPQRTADLLIDSCGLQVTFGRLSTVIGTTDDPILRGACARALSYLAAMDACADAMYAWALDGGLSNLRVLLDTHPNSLRMVLRSTWATGNVDVIASTLDQLGWDYLSRLLPHSSDGSTGSEDDYAIALGHAVLDVSKDEEVSRSIVQVGLQACVQLLRGPGMPLTIEALANIARIDGLAAPMGRMLLPHLANVADGPISAVAQSHLARMIAHLAACPMGNTLLGAQEHAWANTLWGWASSPQSPRPTQKASMAALANMAAHPDGVLRVLGACNSPLVLLKGAFAPVENESHATTIIPDPERDGVPDLSRHCDHLDDVVDALRILTNAAAHVPLARDLEVTHFPVHLILSLVECAVHALPTTDFAVLSARLVANLTREVEWARTMAHHEAWDALLRLARAHPSTNVQSQAVRAFANVVQYASPVQLEAVANHPLIASTLDEWMAKPTLHPHATRAQAALLYAEIAGPKYAEGVHLLHPKVIDTTGSWDVDVVMVHGVAGHYATTWRGGALVEGSKDEEGEYCWPRDWLPKDLLPSRVRVLSIDYEIFLSRWFGDALPLQARSTRVLHQLALAGVGSRPVIFITHSFGGLLVKSLLRTAALDEQESYKDLLENTAGIVFFSTPHLGVDYTRYATWLYSATNAVFRGTPTIDDLQPNSPLLQSLNSDFSRFVPHVPTLSFGEGQTCFGSSFNCYQVVTDASADPGFHGPHHHFVKTDSNHLMVCKPGDESDEKYVITRDFVRGAFDAHPRFES